MVNDARSHSYSYIHGDAADAVICREREGVVGLWRSGQYGALHALRCCFLIKSSLTRI